MAEVTTTPEPSVMGPTLTDKLTFVVIDANNTLLGRPLVGGRAVIEDLLGCIEFLESQELTTLTVADASDAGKDAVEILHRKGNARAWVCEEADPVILEIASRLNRAGILSRDDFAEFQGRYALVLFDPNRILRFQTTNGPGSGTISLSGGVTEKDVLQTGSDTALFSNIVTILDILLTANDSGAAEAFCKDLRQRTGKLGSDGRILRPIVDLAATIVGASRGRFPSRVRQWLLRRRLYAAVNAPIPPWIRQNVSGMHLLLRHLTTSRLALRPKAREALAELTAVLSERRSA